MMLSTDVRWALIVLFVFVDKVRGCGAFGRGVVISSGVGCGASDEVRGCGPSLLWARVPRHACQLWRSSRLRVLVVAFEACEQ